MAMILAVVVIQTVFCVQIRAARLWIVSQLFSFLFSQDLNPSTHIMTTTN